MKYAQRIISRSKRSQLRTLHGFTLIELLIVIAIILILIAIALPNFLEAQIRARVTKTKAELRSIGTAMESYFLDYQVYPAEHERDDFSRNLRGLFWLTSPTSYITSLPEDPFAAFGDDDAKGISYVTYEMGGLEYSLVGNPECRACQVVWVVFSNGPDAEQHIWQENPHYDSGRAVVNYSPTNGTKSRGSIYFWGGDPYYIGIQINSLADQAAIRDPGRLVGLRMDGQRFFKRFPPS